MLNDEYGVRMIVSAALIAPKECYEQFLATKTFVIDRRTFKQSIGRNPKTEKEFRRFARSVFQMLEEESRKNSLYEEAIARIKKIGE